MTSQAKAYLKAEGKRFKPDTKPHRGPQYLYFEGNAADRLPALETEACISIVVPEPVSKTQVTGVQSGDKLKGNEQVSSRSRSVSTSREGSTAEDVGIGNVIVHSGEQLRPAGLALVSFFHMLDEVPTGSLG